MQFHDINKYLIGHFMYQCHTGNVSHPDWYHFFQQNSEIHDYNTSTASHLHTPAVKSDLGKLVSDTVVPSFGITYIVMGTILMCRKLALLNDWKKSRIRLDQKFLNQYL